ncbi:hypothetical protein B1209_21230 [Raoultella planticola]|nr:hypothetical protein CRT62_20765 [Raoultella planticola]AUV54881.1 hypothetical protein B1209_21230 [Raoultella planticola]MBE0012588.1 hypothetical protein [Raoultella planticola]MBE0090637.1 hypothetical protein [Raoultella planticola]OZP71825.1 hypothetical protein CIG23_21095 [Raoultella planticola]
MEKSWIKASPFCRPTIKSRGCIVFCISAHISATLPSIHCDYRSGGAINNQYVRILRCCSQVPLKYFHNIHLTNEV